MTTTNDTRNGSTPGTWPDSGPSGVVAPRVSLLGPEELQETALEGFEALLVLLGRDPLDPAVVETPARAVRALLDIAQPPTEADIAAVLDKRFASPSCGPVFVGPVHFTSMCEHHLLPFTGRAWVAYDPTEGQVVGLSKLARLVQLVAHRPQIQEGMTRHIVTALMQYAPSAGAWCRIEGEHSCMTLRGARASEASMVTCYGQGTLEVGTPLEATVRTEVGRGRA